MPHPHRTEPVTVEQLQKWLRHMDPETKIEIEFNGQRLQVWEAWPGGGAFHITLEPAPPVDVIGYCCGCQKEVHFNVSADSAARWNPHARHSCAECEANCHWVQVV
jgi:hypothetical protein